MNGHHHLTSSHKKRGREESGGGRGGCRHTHGTNGGLKKKHTLTICASCRRHTGLKTQSLFTQWLEADICSLIHFYGVLCCGRCSRRVSTLRFAPRLGFQRTVYFPRQDVARDWFSSGSDAFKGCPKY